MLLTLKYEPDSKGQLTNKIASDVLKVLELIGSKAKTYEEVVKDPIVIKYVEDGIRKANERAISKAQQVRKWTFIPGDFTVDTGELTATLKLKRNVVAQKYADVIDKMYIESKL